MINIILQKIRVLLESFDISGIASSTSSVDTEIKKVDSPLSFISVAKSNSSGNIISAVANKKIYVHHMTVNNHSSTGCKFQIKDGSSGSIIRDFGLAQDGGVVAENFKRPLELSTNTPLYYTYEAGGTGTDVSIAVHYEIL